MYEFKGFTSNQMNTMRDIIGGIESGDMVIGQRNYSDFTPKKNTITIGAYHFSGNNAKRLLTEIRKFNTGYFFMHDNGSGIGNDIWENDWRNYSPEPESSKARSIKNIIGGSDGRDVQNAIFDSTVAAYAQYAANLGCIGSRAVAICVCFIWWSGYKTVGRILDNTMGFLNLDNIYWASKSDAKFGQNAALADRMKLIYDYLTFHWPDEFDRTIEYKTGVKFDEPIKTTIFTPVYAVPMPKEPEQEITEEPVIEEETPEESGSEPEPVIEETTEWANTILTKTVQRYQYALTNTPCFKKPDGVTPMKSIKELKLHSKVGICNRFIMENGEEWVYFMFGGVHGFVQAKYLGNEEDMLMCPNGNPPVPEFSNHDKVCKFVGVVINCDALELKAFPGLKFNNVNGAPLINEDEAFHVCSGILNAASKEPWYYGFYLMGAKKLFGFVEANYITARIINKKIK